MPKLNWVNQVQQVHNVLGIEPDLPLQEHEVPEEDFNHIELNNFWANVNVEENLPNEVPIPENPGIIAQVQQHANNVNDQWQQMLNIMAQAPGMHHGAQLHHNIPPVDAIPIDQGDAPEVLFGQGEPFQEAGHNQLYQFNANELHGFNIEDPNPFNKLRYKGDYKIKILKEEEYMYRTILSKDKRKIIHIRCPKTFDGTNEELFSNLRECKIGYTQVMEIPNKNKISNTIKVRKKDNIKLSKGILVKRESIDLKSHYEATNKYYIKSSNVYYAEHLANIEMNRDYFINTISSEAGTCAENIHVTFIDIKGNIVRGVTTGVFLTKTGQIEVLGFYAVNKRGEIPSYSKDCIINKFNVYYQKLNLIGSTTSYDFYRLRIKSSINSADAFGFKKDKFEMEGKIFNPSQFKVIRKFDSKKLKKVVDVVEITSETKCLKFLLSDVEFLYLDPSKFGVNKSKADKVISSGDLCKVIDDRRCNLQKGDLVRVTNIIINKNAKKKSIITVLANDGKYHKIFLKQLKKVYEQQKSTEIKLRRKKEVVAI